MRKRSEAMAMRKRSDAAKPVTEPRRQYTGEKCSECGHPQFEAPDGSGVTCANGHGGAPGVSMEDNTQAGKPSVASRTLPLPNTTICDACQEPVIPSKVTVRADGTQECGSCGAPLAAGMGSSPPPDPIPAAPTSKKLYCPECGTHWPFVNGAPFSNCGHRGQAIDDPKKAKSYNPPAGHPREDISKAKSPPPMPEAKASQVSTPSVSYAGNMVNVAIGKMTFRIGEYGVNMTVGPFSTAAEVPPDGDRVAIGAKLLQELRALADTAFAEQLTWYASRLGIIQKKLESA